MTPKKLPGSYKGTRKRREPPAIVIIECPGCGWRSQQAEFYTAESEYAEHLHRIHYGALHCAFCKALLPDFKTLANHVQTLHRKELEEKQKASPT